MEAQQTRPPAKSAQALSSDELSEILKEASRRQGEVVQRENAAASVTTLDDAYALAKDLGIPAEYVSEAASKLARQKAVTGEVAATRGGRFKTFLMTAVVSAVGFGAALLLGASGVGLLVIAAALGVITVGMLVRWLWSLASPPLIDEAAPVPGVCRVCLRPAYKPESTFCEEHRYKGSSGQA